MRKLKQTLIASLAITAAGCTVGPNYRAPNPNVPGEFGAATRPATTQPTTIPATQPLTVDLARWWESFEDPALTNLVYQASQANLDVQLAQSRIRQARAELAFNRTSILPTLDLGASYSRARASKNSNAFTPTGEGGDSGTGTPGAAGITGGPTETDLFQGGFDAGWEIDVFGGTRRAIEAAVYTYEAQLEARRNVLVSLTAEVAQNYILLRGYQHQLAIAQRNVVAQQNTVDLQRTRLRAGIATALTVAQAEALLASTRSQLPTLEANIAYAIHRLGVLLNRDPAALRAQLEVEKPLPVGPPVIPPGFPSELVRRRPDVRQAERQLAAATASIGVAVADLFPRFNITGTVGLSAAKLTNFPNRGSVFYSIGPGVSWRLFDFGQTRANIEITNALQEQALINYRQFVLISLEEVENSLVSYDREQARRSSLQQSVDANRRAVDLAEQLYQAGVVDFLNVLTAQQSLFEAENQLAVSESTVSTNLVSLYKALGGGWEIGEQPGESLYGNVPLGQPTDSVRGLQGPTVVPDAQRGSRVVTPAGVLPAVLGN